MYPGARERGDEPVVDAPERVVALRRGLGASV